LRPLARQPRCKNGPAGESVYTEAETEEGEAFNKAQGIVDQEAELKRVSGLLLAALLVAAAVQWWCIPRYCDDAVPGVKGERWIQSDGSVKYFDGRCWSDKPVPPSDTAF